MTVEELITKLLKMPKGLRVITIVYQDSNSSVPYPEDINDVTHWSKGVYGTDGESVVEIGG